MKKQIIRKLPRIPFTKKGYQDVLKKKAELTAQRPETVEELRKAREMGDLSENGYYKAARAKLSSIDYNIRRLTRLEKFGYIPTTTSADRVKIGCQVTISDGKNEYQYQIVGSYESDPAKGKISHRSPIGQALMERRERDEVKIQIPAGETTYTILKINLVK